MSDYVTIARINESGGVQIDWNLVKMIADSRVPIDGTLQGYARILLAARDGTWEPIIDIQH